MQKFEECERPADLSTRGGGGRFLNALRETVRNHKALFVAANGTTCMAIQSKASGQRVILKREGLRVISRIAPDHSGVYFWCEPRPV